MAENKKPAESKIASAATTLGKVGIQVGEKLGKVATEFFMGKQPTKEEKELNAIRKERKLKLKLIQEDAEYARDLALAEKGQYVPPAPKVEVKKEKKAGMFDNLGKYNPVAEFEKNKSLGTTDFGIGGKKENKANTPDFGIGGIGIGNSSKTPDFGLDGFIGTKNPIGKKKRE